MASFPSLIRHDSKVVDVVKVKTAAARGASIDKTVKSDNTNE